MIEEKMNEFFPILVSRSLHWLNYSPINQMQIKCLSTFIIKKMKDASGGREWVILASSIINCSFGEVNFRFRVCCMLWVWALQPTGLWRWFGWRTDVVLALQCSDGGLYGEQSTVVSTICQMAINQTILSCNLCRSY